QLPAPTKFVIGLSQSFVSNWYFYFGGGILRAGGLTWMLRSDKGRDIFDATVLRIPIIGGVLRTVVVARFTRTLGTLLSSGVPILDALEICGKTSGNRTVTRAIKYAKEQISAGKDLATPLAETHVFPPMVVQ